LQATASVKVKDVISQHMTSNAAMGVERQPHLSCRATAHAAQP
jgi:hypothetical protein